MIKQSTTSGSNLCAAGGHAGQRDHFQDDFNSSVSGGTYTFPVWLKLSRSGNTITAYTSPDGVHLDPSRGDHDLADRPGDRRAGRTSHNAGALSTATSTT